jgi:hypothetical protein
MPHFSKSCDIKQGFDYKKDRHTHFGFITAININGTDLTVDLTCKDPTNPTSDLKVVAVLSEVSWATGTTDALSFAGVMSAPNRQAQALMLYNSLTNVTVTFQFDIYEYDPVATKFFKCLTCNGTTMNGLLEKNGSELNMSVADDPATEVQSPINYHFHIGIKPNPTQQSLTIATADQKNLVKQWGVKQG